MYHERVLYCKSSCCITFTSNLDESDEKSHVFRTQKVDILLVLSVQRNGVTQKHVIMQRYQRFAADLDCSRKFIIPSRVRPHVQCFNVSCCCAVNGGHLPCSTYSAMRLVESFSGPGSSELGERSLSLCVFLYRRCEVLIVQSGRIIKWPAYKRRLRTRY